jgi:hypothetical protein
MNIVVNAPSEITHFDTAHSKPEVNVVYSNNKKTATMTF